MSCFVSRMMPNWLCDSLVIFVSVFDSILNWLPSIEMVCSQYLNGAILGSFHFGIGLRISRCLFPKMFPHRLCDSLDKLFSVSESISNWRTSFEMVCFISRNGAILLSFHFRIGLRISRCLFPKMFPHWLCDSLDKFFSVSESISNWWTSFEMVCLISWNGAILQTFHFRMVEEYLDVLLFPKYVFVGNLRNSVM